MHIGVGAQFLGRSGRLISHLGVPFRSTWIDRTPNAVISATEWAFILGLLFSCCPSAITWLVISIGVIAFDCKPYRLLSHISKKILKIHPSLKNRYSTPTIIFVMCVIRIQTSLLHGIPNPIRLTRSDLSIMPMNCSGYDLLRNRLPTILS